MYWKIVKACFNFISSTHHAPSELIISHFCYEQLIQEMYGNQLYVLEKYGEVLGLTVYIDSNESSFHLN